jgi:hypothetical protein
MKKHRLKTSQLRNMVSEKLSAPQMIAAARDMLRF